MVTIFRNSHFPYKRSWVTALYTTVRALNTSSSMLQVDFKWQISNEYNKKHSTEHCHRL